MSLPRALFLIAAAAFLVYLGNGLLAAAHGIIG